MPHNLLGSLLKCGLLGLALGYPDSEGLVRGPDIGVFEAFLRWFGGSHWLMDICT